MIKKFIITICLFASLATFAQEDTASPYSFYGIGELKFSGTVENRAMGGLSIFKDSIHLNIQNPATYSGLKLTSFALGGNTNTTLISTPSVEEKTKRSSLDYLAVGLPLGKFGASFGLVPYASIGYKAINVNTNSTVLKTGSGGVNRVYAGLAYNINPKLSIGFNVNYSFGNINSDVVEYLSGAQYGTQELNNSNVKGINLSTGLAYQTVLKNKKTITASLVFTPESNLNFENNRTISNVQYSNGNHIPVDDLEIVVPNSTLKLPTKISFGAGFGKDKKWQVGTELVWQENSKMTNRIYDAGSLGTFENSTKYIFGGYYIPKYNSFTNYFSRVVYRAGFNFQNTGLVMKGKSIKDQAVTVGLGLPLSGSFSSINLGFEFGKKGSHLNGLVQESYTNFSIGLSFNDRWFVKRKYD